MNISGVSPPRLSALYPVEDQLQISTVRLHATATGRAHGLDADALERLDLVVAEMAANITRHAGSGQIILRAIGEHGAGCVEILALDKGAGIADMTRVLRDSGAISGEFEREGGLPGIRRLTDLFDIYSQSNVGTAVVAHIGVRSSADIPCFCTDLVTHSSLGAVCVPVHGEEECGDGWAVEVSANRITALLVDGLGHGPGAAAAADAALSICHQAFAQEPDAMLNSMHVALRSTRGAALSVTAIDTTGRTARFCGVGNVEGRILQNGANRHLVPQNGIVGHTMPRAIATGMPWPANARLVMHSDGISSRWRIDNYPGLLARHPALLAGVLFRDFARSRDDATVIVLREPLPEPIA